MLKERARLLNTTILLLDLGLVALAFVRRALAAQLLPAAASPPVPSRAGSTRSGSTCRCCPWRWRSGVLLLLSSGAYRSHRTVPLLAEAWNILRVNGTGARRLRARPLRPAPRRTAARGRSGQPRLARSLRRASQPCCCSPRSSCVRVISRYVRSRGYNYRTLLVVGTGKAARAIARAIDEHDYWGFRVAGFVDGGAGEHGIASAATPCWATVEEHRRGCSRDYVGRRRHLRRRPQGRRAHGGPLPRARGAGDPHHAGARTSSPTRWRRCSSPRSTASRWSPSPPRRPTRCCSPPSVRSTSRSPR